MRRIVLGLALALGLFATMGGADIASAHYGYYPTVVATKCTTVGVAATVSWAPMGYGSQYLDYGYGGGFYAGAYQGMGPYSTSTGTVVISNLTPGTTVAIRVNTFAYSTWYPTTVIYYRVPVCQTFVAPIVPTHPMPYPVMYPYQYGAYMGPQSPQYWAGY